MESQRCHHCGLPGHKKYECNSKCRSNCRVGCRWGEKFTARRPPIVHRGSLEVQGQHNVVNTQRNHGSTEINGGHLSLPQQYPHNVNDVRFSHNVQQGSMHLQQNVAENVQQHASSNMQQHIPGNLQQHVTGNMQQHVTGTLQVNNASIPLFGQQSNGNSAAAALLDPTLGPLLQSALEVWPFLQHYPQQQTQQINNTNLFGSQASNQQAQTFLLQHNTQNLGYVQNPQQTAQYLQAQLQQLLSASMNNVNVNNATSQAVSTVDSQVPITMTSAQPFAQQIVPSWNGNQVNVNQVNQVQAQIQAQVQVQGSQQLDQVLSRQSTKDNNVSSLSLIVPTTTSDPPIKEEVLSDNQVPLERQEMTERLEMTERQEMTGRPETTERPEATERPETTERPEMAERQERQEMTKRLEMTERLEMPQQEKEATEQQTRRPGETNAEIITKLKALRDKIKEGLHPRIKPPRWVPCNQQVERQHIQKEAEKDSARQFNNDNGSSNSNVSNSNNDNNGYDRHKDISRQSDLLGLGMRERSPAMTGVEQWPSSPTIYRSRRSRSPFNAYRYEKEGANSDYRRYRNRSRSASPRRAVRNDYILTGSVSPSRFRTRSITEYDERYYVRNPGQEFRDKYPPRGVSMAMYEELRHGRHNERYERPFGRSRSPIGYPGGRRQNVWHGEPYERERPGHEFHYEFAHRRQTSRW